MEEDEICKLMLLVLDYQYNGVPWCDLNSSVQRVFGSVERYHHLKKYIREKRYE